MLAGIKQTNLSYRYTVKLLATSNSVHTLENIILNNDSNLKKLFANFLTQSVVFLLFQKRLWYLW